MPLNFEPLRYWIEEREAIRIRKERGDPFPWTADEILKTYRFCNVRREDDRGTVWVRENIREVFPVGPYLWLMCCIARQINWPDTLAELIAKGAWPNNPAFTPELMTATLRERKARGDKVYTGAYMISAPSVKGTDKQEYIAETVIGELWRNRKLFVDYGNGPTAPTLYGTHERLTRFNGWGPFMAYQACVDMRFTVLLENAADRFTWAAAGPGTLRGLNRVHGREVTAALSQSQALIEMRDIYSRIQKETNVAVDFSDVPNVLCETDKYLRVKQQEGKPRALYVPGRGC